MKNKDIVRKIAIFSLVGFPIGITLLMINYAGLYLIAGEKGFQTEIAQLQNISTLLIQLIIVGFSYYLYFILINVIANINGTKSNNDKFVLKHPYKTILIMIIFMIVFALILMLLCLKKFSENISIMNVTTFIIVLVSCGIYFCLKVTYESDLIKKINQKLKERNN